MKRSPSAAVFLSLLPGLGHVYVGQAAKGFLLGLSFFLAIQLADEAAGPHEREERGPEHDRQSSERGRAEEEPSGEALVQAVPDRHARVVAGDPVRRLDRIGIGADRDRDREEEERRGDDVREESVIDDVKDAIRKEVACDPRAKPGDPDARPCPKPDPSFSGVRG